MPLLLILTVLAALAVAAVTLDVETFVLFVVLFAVAGGLIASQRASLYDANPRRRAKTGNRGWTE